MDLLPQECCFHFMTSEMKLKTDEFRKDGLGYSRTVNSLCKQEKQLQVLSMDRKKCTSCLDRKSQLRKIVPSYLPDVPPFSFHLKIHILFQLSNQSKVIESKEKKFYHGITSLIKLRDYR